MRRVLLLGCLALLSCSGAWAHLLNMTSVQVDVAAEGRVDVDIKIDLTRAVGGSLEYFRLSRVAQPLSDAEIRSLLDKLAAAVELRVSATGGSPLDGSPIPLHVARVEFPLIGREAFLDPLNWPMTHVVLTGVLPAAQAPATAAAAAPGGRSLFATFEPGFHFEEPIALTFQQLPELRRMTRWLVTSQSSPAFWTTGAGAPVSAGNTDTPSLGQFVRFGFLHILPKGLDHVLFVLGLYLGARSLQSLLWLVTCFTLAHSITLGLAAIGIIRLSPAVVEPLISASIAWVGIENTFAAGRTERYRPFLVFGFGLLHGLGFASALAALDAPQSRFLASLLSFNGGIELGQLTVIAGALLLTLAFRKRPWYRQRVVLPGSAVIALIAVAWTVQRLTA